MKTEVISLMIFCAIVIAVVAVAMFIGESPLPEKAEAQTFKTYQIRILGDFMGVMQYKFEIEATHFLSTWDGGYYRFTKLNGEQVYYPVSRTIVTVKP